jgi:hypothetical protein
LNFWKRREEGEWEEEIVKGGIYNVICFTMFCVFCCFPTFPSLRIVEKPAGLTQKPAGFSGRFFRKAGFRRFSNMIFHFLALGASLALGRPPRAGTTLALGQYERRILITYHSSNNPSDPGTPHGP